MVIYIDNRRMVSLMGSPKLEGIVKCRGLKLERPLNTQLVRYKYRTVQASQVIYGDKSYFANAQTFIIYSYPEQTHEACAKHYRQLLPVFSSLHPTDKSFIVYFVEMICWEELEKKTYKRQARWMPPCAYLNLYADVIADNAFQFICIPMVDVTPRALSQAAPLLPPLSSAEK